MLTAFNNVRTYLGQQARTANASANTGSDAVNDDEISNHVDRHTVLDYRAAGRHMFGAFNYEADQTHNINALHCVGGAHHIMATPVGRSRVPSEWGHNATGVEAQNVVEPPVVESAGIVRSYVERFTRKAILDDLAKTMIEAQKDQIDEVGELRVSRTLYARFVLWAERKYVSTEAQRRFRTRLLYRFETTSELVALFKVLNPRPFGFKKEARLCIVGEFGKMMKEIRRLWLADTHSETIPESIISMYNRVVRHDKKFHEWVCILGPSLVAVHSQTQALADRVWALAVEEAESTGAEW
jgi:hypothetical protein